MASVSIDFHHYIQFRLGVLPHYMALASSPKIEVPCHACHGIERLLASSINSYPDYLNVSHPFWKIPISGGRDFVYIGEMVKSGTVLGIMGMISYLFLLIV